MTGTATVIVNANANATGTTATARGTTKIGAHARTVGTMTTRRTDTARLETTGVSETRHTTAARRSARRRGRKSATMRTGPRGIIATTSGMIGDVTGAGPGATTRISRLHFRPTSLRRSGRIGSEARPCTGTTLVKSVTVPCTKTGRLRSVLRRCVYHSRGLAGFNWRRSDRDTACPQKALRRNNLSRKLLRERKLQRREKYRGETACATLWARKVGPNTAYAVVPCSCPSS